MTCPLCSQPVTVPLIDVWCANCGTYVRAHDGCTPGVTSTEGHDRILAAHMAIGGEPYGSNGAITWPSRCDLTIAMKFKGWDADRDALSEKPLERPDYLKESTHVPGSSLGRRGRKVGQ